jgi:hypothetical protein
MSSDMQELNEQLKSVRDGIHAIRPGPDRDKLQSRFDRMLDRIALVPDRVMAEFDKRGLTHGGPEVAAIWRVEMQSALNIWSEDA